MKEILKFAAKHNLFVFADEVYQHNVYAEGSKFSSFKKVSNTFTNLGLLLTSRTINTKICCPLMLVFKILQIMRRSQVLREMGPPCDTLELASFMSISKGYMGECGLRGGWMELVNLDPDVQANLYKAISAMLCPSTIGQCTVDTIVSILLFPFYSGNTN